MTELAPSSPATSHQIWLGSLVSLNNDSDEVAIRVFFLDGSFKVLTINEYTTADDLHRCLVAKLRNVSSVGVDMNDPLMQEFGLFIVSETGSMQLANPKESIIAIVEASFQQENDRFEFRRRIYPTPVPDSLTIPTQVSHTMQPAAMDPQNSILYHATSASTILSNNDHHVHTTSSPKKKVNPSSSGTDSEGTDRSLTASNSSGGASLAASEQSSRSRSRSSSVPALADFSKIDSPIVSPKASPRPDPTHNERFCFPVPTNNVELWLEFLTCVSLVHSNSLFRPRSIKEIFELSALQVLVTVKREGGSAKQRIKNEIDRFFPPRFTSLVKRSVAKEQILITYADLKLVSTEKAQQEYVSIVQRWKFYGTIFFFDCKCTDKKLWKNPVVLGVNEDGLIVLKSKDGDTLALYPFSTLVSWSSSFSSITFEYVVDQNDEETVQQLTFETNQGELIGATIQAYIDKKIRMTACGYG